jgi:hypothetical protein
MKYRGWFTEQERKQIFQELRYLKNYDRENQVWRDLRLLDFRREVLDKYRNHEFCKIGRDYISFLEKDKKTPESSVSFVVSGSNKNIIMVQAKNFIYVPPKERKHWQLYQINK